MAQQPTPQGGDKAPTTAPQTGPLAPSRPNPTTTITKRETPKPSR
jgi:hypothetical protein